MSKGLVEVVWMSQKTLIIIGAGHEQIPAYQLAKSFGVRVVGTDMNPEAPAFAYADDHLIASTRDVEQTLNVVLEYAKDNDIVGVMTIGNDVPLTVATVANKLNLLGISVEAAKNASNKIDMKSCFSKCGIATPEYCFFKNKGDFLDKVNEWGYPLILKPSDGRGSRGVLYIDDTIDLDWSWDHSLQHCDNGILLLEKFSGGRQLSIEGVFVEGKYIPIACADRNYDHLPETKPYIIEDGGVIPSNIEGKSADVVFDLVEQAALSLGINWGSVKADIVFDGDEPQIIELAARLSGNYLATHYIPKVYGVDIVGTVIKLSLGQKIDPDLVMPQKGGYLGVRFFFPKPGVIKSIKGVDDVKKMDHIEMIEVYRRDGDIQQIIDSNVQRAGVVICSAQDYFSADKRVEEAKKLITFEMA